MELIFATNNKHKISEVQEIIGSKIRLCNLSQTGIVEELPENQVTLEGNALEKARFVFAKTGKNCFADDTGLEVEALNGEPGVYSARYAGPENNSEANLQKLLQKLSDKNNRKAQFRCVIALIINNKEWLFEGVVKGKIINEKRGGDGFGYDPIFIPEGYEKTFAEMSLSQKNKISHRAIAVNKLADFLRNY
jgi:XTP/dITP diphosphohydrolase